MPRVIHFELQADEPERAKAFYSKVFEWTFNSWGDGTYWLIGTGPDDQPGINGGMLKRMGPINYVNVVGVDDIDTYAASVLQNGGQIVVPKSTVPGIGYLIYCKDTEDNVFGMMQPDDNAK